MNTGIKEIFKSDVARLCFDYEYGLAYLSWEGTLTLEKYKAPFLFMINDFKPEVTGIMSDLRRQSVVGPEMRQWLQNEATPKAIERGLKFFYVVSDANVFKQYYVQTVFRRLGVDGVERKIFSDYDKCEQAIQAKIKSYKPEYAN